MKTSRLHYFKRNTIELPEGYRKPVKRKRKTVVEPAVPAQAGIVVAKPVIRRRTPRGRLMPLRMKNEFIPPGVDWCQINGQKVRQDIYFGDVRGRMFIPGRMTGEGCEGACTPSIVDFGGGCGCEGCDSGCEGGGGCDAGCETGCAVDGCAGCGSDTGCETAGCETAGCAETGCTTTSDTGCTDSGCAQSGCAETGCTTTSDTGCTACADSGCASCADSGCSTGCGGCEGCISCADAGCASCADTGCSMAPTGGVDFTGGGMGFGYGPGPDTGNLGIGNAMGPPGWATGDFGAYGSGGPTGTGFGPDAQGASIGGPGVYAAAPGINGFPGDFGAPPGGAFGMPNTQDVGPQAGPGLLGGPPTVQQGEALNPSLFGPEVAPAAPPVVDPNSRTDVDPLSDAFGPAFATNQAAPTAGNFGGFIGQAQAGQNMTNQGVIDAANMANAFARTGDDMSAYIAATNPGLAQALSNIANDPAYQAANYAGPSLGAQQGFTGVSPAQAAAGGPFTGQSSFGNESTQGKGDRGDTAPVSQAYPGAEQTLVTSPSMYNVDPVAPSQGWPGQTATAQPAQTGVPTVDPATVQQGYQQLAEQMNAQQNQQNMVAAQELGEQGKGAPTAQTTPQQTISNAFEALTAANQQQAMQQAAPFDAQARGEQGRGPDSFDSRFGDPSQFMPAATLSADALDTQSRGEQGKGEQLAPWAQAETETIGLRPGEDVISSLNPATWGVGREAAPLGLWSMQNEPAGRPGGSPFGNPTQAGSVFGPPGGRPGGETSGRPGLSITVGNNQYAAGRPGGGYYQTGGAGIAPGAKGAEYGGAYGVNSPGRPGSGAFGGDFRQGGGGGAYFYDPATGQYFIR